MQQIRTPSSLAERFPPQLLVLLPAVFSAYFITCCTPVYIRELHLSIPRVLVVYGATFFTILWLSCHSLRTLSRSYFYQASFYLFPIAIFSFLYLLQWHFFPCAVLLLLLSGAAVCSAIQARRGSGRSWQGLLRSRRKLRQRLVEIFAMGLILPGFLGGAVCYELTSPIYLARQTFLTEIVRDIGSESGTDTPRPSGTSFAENRSLLCQFQPSVWSQLTFEAQLENLQALAGLECLQFGIPSDKIPQLISKKLEYATLAQYLPAENKIAVDLQYLEQADPFSLLTVLSEEVFHACQFYLVSSINWDDPVTDTEFFDTIRDWKENMTFYVSGYISPELYQQQPLEASAQTWADTQVDAIKACLYETPDDAS